MNGLQTVSVSLCKRIRCLPPPPGTRGRTLSRRLAHAAQSPPTLDATAQDQLQPPSAKAHVQPILDTQSVRTTLKESADAVNRLQNALDQAIWESEKGMPPPESSLLLPPSPSSPSPSEAAVPLDPTLTDLDAIPIPSPDSPVGSLLQALDQRDSAAVWQKFREIDGRLLLKTVKPHEFAAVLHSLQPGDFLALRNRHHHHPVSTISEEQAFRELKRRLMHVLSRMRTLGHRLSARECNHLIDCARAGRDSAMAVEFWNLMCGLSVAQDTWTYNSFMAALGGGTASVARDFCVSADSLAYRASRTRPGEEDVRRRVKRIFERMTARRIVPNSMTFEILMLSMARVADLAAVKRVVEQVWGVHVDSLAGHCDNNDKRGRGEEKGKEKPCMPKDSPLYPTSHTLLAIATAFCQNAAVDTAVRLVDHMSRIFDIPISVPTWVTLMNWAYVYSRQRASDGALPGSAVQGMWAVMTGEPYKVTPTMDMYDYIVRSYLWRRMPGAAERTMDTALTAISLQMVGKAKEIEQRIVYGRRPCSSSSMPPGEKPPQAVVHTRAAIARFGQQVAALVRDEHRLRSMARRWVELLVTGKHLEVTMFGPRNVPNIVHKWLPILGGRVVYVLRTGFVELHLSQWRSQGWEPVTTRKRRWMLWTYGTGAKEEDDFF